MVEDRTAAPAGHGRLRASHADREHVLDVLKAAFVLGLLTKDDFDMRVARALASRTYAELGPLTAGLPARLPAAEPLRKPAGTQYPHPENKIVNSCACAALAVLALGGSVLSGNFGLFFVFLAVAVGVLLAVAGRMAWGQVGRRRRVAPGSAAGPDWERPRPSR